MRIAGTSTAPFAVKDDIAWLPDEPSTCIGEWFVLHTKSRQEKALASTLSAEGITHFLPLIGQSKYHGKRKVFVEIPLFPGYIFVRGNLSDAHRATRTRRVARILRVKNQEQLDIELRNIQLALSNSAQLDPFPFLCAGVRVEVRSGPFRGLQGFIEDKTTRNRLILQVEMLGKAVSLEIDGALLEALEYSTS